MIVTIFLIAFFFWAVMGVAFLIMSVWEEVLSLLALFAGAFLGLLIAIVILVIACIIGPFVLLLE